MLACGTFSHRKQFQATGHCSHPQEQHHHHDRIKTKTSTLFLCHRRNLVNSWPCIRSGMFRQIPNSFGKPPPKRWLLLHRGKENFSSLSPPKKEKKEGIVLLDSKTSGRFCLLTAFLPGMREVEPIRGHTERSLSLRTPTYLALTCKEGR